MVSRSRLKSLLTRLALYTIAAAMVGYFGVNAYTGKYGLNARQELDQEIIALTSELARLKRERAQGEQRISEFESVIVDLAVDDHAILYMTSGATGEPKMGLVTHAAVVANMDHAPFVLPLTPRDATIAFLPSAHIAQRVVIELLPMRCGMPITFAESLLKLPQDIRRVRPTILLAPPRMWERIYSTICTELRKRPAPQWSGPYR